ncbi:MAG TPA: single-stranded DNA-binding protein [Candidatus Binataceae bacterium]|nr:single-stranded DNA-binding protein [Candidatus Binataceae bacterium]
MSAIISKNCDITEWAAARGFSVATNDSFTDKNGQKQERVDCHQVVVYGRLALICKEYLAKGRHVYVEGRLCTREYEARDNNGKRYRTEIIAQGMQFLGARPEVTAGGDATIAGEDEATF